MATMNRYEIPENVTWNVERYLAENNLGELVAIQRKSNHLDDWYLYMVSVKKGTEYKCWTAWNETTQCLNNGHYGLSSEEECEEIFDRNFNDILKVRD